MLSVGYKESPSVIYTDRDCCSSSGQSRLSALFNASNDVQIRIDVWHFMHFLHYLQYYHCFYSLIDISLYTIIGHTNKGGIQLPLSPCARGSTSLESFHLHLARFIPGTSTNDIHFQAYLLDGVTRWNHSRGQAAIQGTPLDGSWYLWSTTKFVVGF